MGGFYGSINDNILFPFTDTSKNVPIDKDRHKTRPIFMNEEAPVEENEEPIVLEGGVEENVYFPEDDGQQDEEVIANDDVYIPDDEQEERQSDNKYDLSDEDLADILQNIIKSRTSTSQEEQTFLDNDFSTLPKINTTKHSSLSLPQLQTSLNQEEIKEMWEKLLEELRKMLSKTHSNWTNNNIFTGSLVNNNKLSMMETAKEISKLKSRQNQKAEIDEYLNDYVKRKNVPDEYKNALRHRAGSLLMAKKLGDNDKSQLWGNMKEFRDLLTSHDSNIGSAIDAQNNYIGRTIYDKYKKDNLSDDEYMDKIMESIKKYNPNETNFNEWQNKNSKIPLKGAFDIINNKMRSKK